jgi:hypothetical protein
MGREREVVPDAVYERADGAARVFVEMDRSSLSKDRVVDAVRRYAAYGNGSGRDPFQTRLPARLLYVTRSDHRAKGLLKTCRLVNLGGLEFSALKLPRAARWLAGVLFDEELPVEEETDFEKLYREAMSALTYALEEGQGLAEMIRRQGLAIPPLDGFGAAEACLRKSKEVA